MLFQCQCGFTKKVHYKYKGRTVRCPRCRVWHHHSDTGESCWRYADTCALCDQPTDLDRAEFAWTPGDL